MPTKARAVGDTRHCSWNAIVRVVKQVGHLHCRQHLLWKTKRFDSRDQSSGGLLAALLVWVSTVGEVAVTQPAGGVDVVHAFVTGGIPCFHFGLDIPGVQAVNGRKAVIFASGYPVRMLARNLA